MHYQNKPKLRGVYSQNNFPDTAQDEVYVVNLGEYSSIRTHWIAFYVNGNSVTYFDSFVVKHILKEIKEFLGNKNIIINIFRIQAYDSVMCGNVCIGFVDFTFKGKI